MSSKIIIKYCYLQFREVSSNTALLKFGQTKSDLRQPSWPKVKFKENFHTIFHFTLPFFQVLFKRWINNKLKFIIVIFTSYFVSYSIVLYYTILTKHFQIMVGAAIKKKPGSLMPKQSNDSSVKPRAAGNKHVLRPVQLMLWKRMFRFCMEIILVVSWLFLKCYLSIDIYLSHASTLSVQPSVAIT